MSVSESRYPPAQPIAFRTAEVNLESIALFLDIDGTLLEIAEHPDGVIVPDTLPPLLNSLHDSLDGAMAFLTGRGLADVETLFPDLPIPAAGLHGFETRFANEEALERRQPEGLEEIVSSLDVFCQAHPDVFMERKGVSIALHYRQCPEHGDAVADIANQVSAKHADFTVIHGKMVVEIKPARVNKGTAIDEFMSRVPFSGRTPFFFGDDVTDEAGFEAVRQAGGVAVRIGDDRATVAPYFLPDVSAMHAWLADLQHAVAENTSRHK